MLNLILSNLQWIAFGLFAIGVLAGLGAYVYFRTDYFEGPGETEFKAYIRELGRQHDVVAEVEWRDGNVTYLGGDYNVEGEYLELENGLEIELPGQSGDPVNLYGVPMIRTSAHVAAPFDTELAIAAEKEEEGDYTRVNNAGEQVDVPDSAVDSMEAVADGGVANVTDHEYEWGGTAYSLSSLWERSPAVSYHTLEKQFELGKKWAREGHDRLKTHAMAFFGGLATALAIWLLFRVVGAIL